jgi:hypothetical protein
MKVQPFLAALTAVNLLLLILLLARVSTAQPRGDGTVLRGRALEILDERGRVRASIKVHPADRTREGTPTPDTVMLRLIDPNGRPEVKLGASEQGAGLGLVGATDSTQALLGAEGAQASLRLRNDDGRQQLVSP